MNKTTALVAFLGSLALPLKAQTTKWTPLNTALAVSSTAGLIMDWSLTVNGIRTPGTYEFNPLLGLHPSLLRLNVYFTTVIGGNLLLAKYLPNPWRNLALAVMTTVEVVAVRHNFGLGLHLGLPF